MYNRRFAFAFVLLIFFSAWAETAYAGDKYSLVDCSNPVYPVDEFSDKRWNFNADKVSAAYSLFAAASNDAYFAPGDKNKFLKPNILHQLGWGALPWNDGENRFESEKTGLIFDTYYKETKECIFVIISIRGTDGADIRDWWSNAAWITSLVPIDNQYREIDRSYPLVLKFLGNKFPSKKISVVATGHSLGGGLSEHLAKCSPEVSAVVFDTSFVDLSKNCKKTDYNIVEIYDKEETLTKVRNLFGYSRKKHKNDDRLSTYGINPYELGNTSSSVQHRMIGMALGMLRAPLDCLKTKDNKCEIKSFIDRQDHRYQKVLLCESFAASPARRQEFSDVCTKKN